MWYPKDLSDKPHKPRWKRVVWAVVLLLGLPSMYVGSYLSFNFMIGIGITTEAQCDPLHDIVYAPLLYYRHSNLPGSYFFRQSCEDCFMFGFERKAKLARYGWRG